MSLRAAKVIALSSKIVTPVPIVEPPLNGLYMAFSRKKLINTYTGKCYAIARDDSATYEVEFGNVQGLNSFLSGQNGFITTWYNQAIVGFDLPAFSTGTRPKVNTTNLNTVFDGTSYLRITTIPTAVRTGLTSTSGFSIFVKGFSTSTSVTNKTIFQQSGSNFATQLQLHWNNSAFRPEGRFARISTETFTTLTAPASSIADNENCTIGLSLIYSATTPDSSLLKNSTVLASNNSFSISASENSYPRQYNLASPGSGSNFWSGEVESFLYYNRGLSSSEISSVLASLNQ